MAYLDKVRFVETPVFTEDIENELSLDEYRQLQLALLLRPTQGALIRGSGGLRKVRWRRAGGGKELLSNLVYGGAESGGFPSYHPFIDAIDELHLGDQVSELTEAP